MGPNRQGEPLFTSYQFVYGDLATGGMTLTHYLPDLGEFIAFDGEPAQVPQPFITWLQTQGEEAGRRAVASSTPPAANNSPAGWQRVLQVVGECSARETILSQALRQTDEREPPGGSSTPDVARDGLVPEGRLPCRCGTRG